METLTSGEQGELSTSWSGRLTRSLEELSSCSLCCECQATSTANFAFFELGASPCSYEVVDNKSLLIPVERLSKLI